MKAVLYVIAYPSEEGRDQKLNEIGRTAVSSLIQLNAARQLYSRKWLDYENAETGKRYESLDDAVISIQTAIADFILEILAFGNALDSKSMSERLGLPYNHFGQVVAAMVIENTLSHADGFWFLTPE